MSDDVIGLIGTAMPLICLGIGVLFCIIGASQQSRTTHRDEAGP